MVVLAQEHTLMEQLEHQYLDKDMLEELELLMDLTAVVAVQAAQEEMVMAEAAEQELIHQ
jgi:hypothetical protein